MSMREQANQAGVSHSTMMRLARWLGFEGYEGMRRLYAQALRERGERLRPILPMQDASDCSAAGVAADTLAAQITRFGEHDNAVQLFAAAKLVAEAQVIFGLGFGASHPVVSHFVRTVSSLLSQERKAVLVANSHCGGAETLLDGRSGDLALAVGIVPYERTTIDFAQRAVSQGVMVVAITDSRVSPLARIAQETIVVTSKSGSFFSSLVPAFAAVEILVALAALSSDVDAAENLRLSQERLAAFDIYWTATR